MPQPEQRQTLDPTLAFLLAGSGNNLTQAEKRAILRKGGITVPEPGIFDRIIQGAGSFGAIGAGIGQLFDRPTTTISRDVPAAGSVELQSLARQQALHGALLSGVGLRETLGPPGTSTLTDVGVPPTPLQASGERLGMQASRLLGGNQGRTALISALRARIEGGGGVGQGVGQGMGLGLGNMFTGSVTGPGFTSPIRGNGRGGAGGNGGLGLAQVLPLLSALGGAAIPIIQHLLGRGGQGVPTPGTPTPRTPPGAPPGTPPGAPGSIPPVGVPQGIDSVLASVDAALAARGLAPLTDAQLADLAAQHGAGFPELAAESGAFTPASIRVEDLGSGLMGSGLTEFAGGGIPTTLSGGGGGLGLEAGLATSLTPAAAAAFPGGIPDVFSPAFSAFAGPGADLGLDVPLGLSASQGAGEGLLGSLTGFINPVTISLAALGYPIGLGLKKLFNGRSASSPARRELRGTNAVDIAKELGLNLTPEEENLVRRSAMNGGATNQFHASVGSLSENVLLARQFVRLSGGNRAQAGLGTPSDPVHAELLRRGIDPSPFYEEFRVIGQRKEAEEAATAKGYSPEEVVETMLAGGLSAEQAIEVVRQKMVERGELAPEFEQAS